MGRRAPQELRQKEALAQRMDSDVKLFRSGAVPLDSNSGVPLDGLKLQDDLRDLTRELAYLRVRAARYHAYCEDAFPALRVPLHGEPQLWDCRGKRDPEAVEQ